MNSSTLRKLLLIGGSTGSPSFIESIVSSLPPILNATIVIAQHMDTLSLKSFAKRLDRLSDREVIFASEEKELQNETIYILAETFIIEKKATSYFLKKYSRSDNIYNPTIDELFFSGAILTGVEIDAYILSGIGADGANGMLKLRESGARTTAQDEKSSIVYGMPKRAKEIGAAQEVASIEQIINKIKSGI